MLIALGGLKLNHHGGFCNSGARRTRAHTNELFFKMIYRQHLFRSIWFESDWSKSELPSRHFDSRFVKNEVKVNSSRSLSGVFCFLWYIQFGEFVPLDVACS